MSPELIGVIGLVVFLAFVYIGMPITIAFLLVGIAGIALFRDWAAHCRSSAAAPSTR